MLLNRLASYRCVVALCGEGEGRGRGDKDPMAKFYAQC